MKNFTAPGNMVSIAAPAGGVLSGQVVILANIVGIAACDAAAGAPVELAVEGIFSLAKTPADVLTAGGIAKVAAGVVGAAGTMAIGWIVANAAAGSTTVLVRLTPGIAAGTTTLATEAAAPEHEPREHAHAKR
jgi:predicted RecA/RadA family phage recombinase